MAAIDHTVIVYKNGEYVKDPFVFDEDGAYLNICPFDYSRDGEITAIYEEDGTKIEVLLSFLLAIKTGSFMEVFNYGK